MARPGPQRPSRIAALLAKSRGAMASVALFSGVVNILALTGSFYMLQVYDRVLASRSIPTLVALSVICFGLFALQGLLEIIRGQVLSRVGARLERELLQPVHALVMRLPLAGRTPTDVTQPVRDMEAVRTFLSGQAPIAFLDLPWMPFYLAFIFILHPWLGWLSVGGMLVLIGLTVLTELRMRDPARDAANAAAKRFQAAETTRRNFEVLRAMGFGGRAAARFYAASTDLFKATERASDVAGLLGGLSRVFRMALQSAMLGLGAYLVLKNQMTAGAIIASSIISGRALAPVELAIANWKLFSAARQSRARLDDLLHVLDNEVQPIDLPVPSKTIEIEGLAVAPPGSRIPVLRNARLMLQAGDGVAILGPSGAGKSTLARALVGAWPALAGAVRLDGAPLGQYPLDKLGQIIGYLPQDVELFDGTIAENIARLDPDADESLIIAAAQAAHVHDLILHLPDGYKTRMGEGGFNLSVGQRQRVGLARAMYGNPFLVVLDEPNAHLDQEGDAALSEAIANIRARGGVVVAVSHRPSILESVNLAAIVAEGEVKAFGPKDEVLKRATGAPMPSSAPPVSGVSMPQRPASGLFQSGGTMTTRMPGMAQSAPARPRRVPDASQDIGKKQP